MLYPVILAGGGGTRLWPISTKSNPKQIRALLGEQTLLQNTYDRILSAFDRQNIFLTTSKNIETTVKKQLKIQKNNLFIEPQPKGTAVAIGLAALKLSEIDPRAIAVIINSDQYVKEIDKYTDSIKLSEKIIDKYPEKILLFGIKPTYPETGYGYIELGQKIEQDVFAVKSFREKPNLETVKDYLSSNNHFWNPAIFIFRVDTLLAQYRKYLPDIYQVLMNIKENPDSLEDEYKKVRNIAIDYGLMEKTKDLLVMPIDITWADIGSWRALRDIKQSITGKKNITNSKNVLLDCQDNLLYSSNGKLITAIGIKDTILVETEDNIFLCKADRSQDIKELLNELKKENLDKHL